MAETLLRDLFEFADWNIDELNLTRDRIASDIVGHIQNIVLLQFDKHPFKDTHRFTEVSVEDFGEFPFLKTAQIPQRFAIEPFDFGDESHHFRQSLNSGIVSVLTSDCLQHFTPKLGFE